LIEGRTALRVPLYKGTTPREGRRAAQGRRKIMHYAGIDWADRHHDAVVIDETGRLS